MLPKYEIVELPVGSTPEWPLSFFALDTPPKLQAYTLTENGWHEEFGDSCFLQEFPTIEEIEFALSKFWTKKKVDLVQISKRWTAAGYVYGCIIGIK